MPNIGPMELIVVLAIALIVLGPRKLPEVGKSLGKGIRGFKDSLAGIHENDHATPAQISPPQTPHASTDHDTARTAPTVRPQHTPS